MPIPAPGLKTLTAGRLDHYASTRWPQLEEVTIRWHGGYGYVTGHLPDDDQLPLCRLHRLGSETDWGFALYQASSETYTDTLLPNGQRTGTPEQALDCALGLYLADPNYPTALAQGWPVASGVIEGTCRYLIADRMDITGARGSVNGAEAVLKLRAVRANNHFDHYWTFHLNNERHPIHETRYAQETIPTAA